MNKLITHRKYTPNHEVRQSSIVYVFAFHTPFLRYRKGINLYYSIYMCITYHIISLCLYWGTM